MLAVVTAVGSRRPRCQPVRFQACSKYVSTSLLSRDVRAEMKVHRVDDSIIASHIIWKRGTQQINGNLPWNSSLCELRPNLCLLQVLFI